VPDDLHSKHTQLRSDIMIVGNSHRHRIPCGGILLFLPEDISIDILIKQAVTAGGRQKTFDDRRGIHSRRRGRRFFHLPGRKTTGKKEEKGQEISRGYLAGEVA